MRQLDEAHMVPLVRFVNELRTTMGDDVAIPHFDPWDGGVAAEVLFLLEAPGPQARNSGFVSMNNPDESAKNFYEILHEVGIDRKRIVIWNIVPWYIGAHGKIRPARAQDVDQGSQSLGRLCMLLPRLRALIPARCL